MKKTKKKLSKSRKILIFLGCCCLIAAATLHAYNKWDDNRATAQSQELADNISALLESGELSDMNLDGQNDSELDNIDEATESASNTVMVSGYEISGILSIPAIDIKLAIISEWSYPFLTVSACRYSGSPEQQMILLAHNYAKHFGKLDKLVPGDTVSYTDVNGTVYEYEVTGTEIWDTGQLREIISGDTWDLTLFTCTYGGASRVVVRCVKI